MSHRHAELIEAIAERAAELALVKRNARDRGVTLPAPQAAAAARDLEAKLAELLARRPGLTVPKIGRTLRTRQQTIRQKLNASASFSSRSGLQGRSPKARGWFVTSDSSPTDPVSRTSAHAVVTQGDAA